MLYVAGLTFLTSVLGFLVSEEKEEEDETEDAGLDDWEAMVSDEDGEKGGHINTKCMFILGKGLWAKFSVSVENNILL